MLYEQGINFIIDIKEIMQKLSQQKNEINYEDIIINYFGDRKNLKKNIYSTEKNNFINSLLFINYKEIYIGGVSFLNPRSREKFGLNKYSKNSFYLGQWEKNTKNGIGILQINKNIMYMGNFVKNQIHGYGMLYYVLERVLYIGDFSEGKFMEGMCYLQKNDICYRGKIKNGKKCGDFCTYVEFKKNRIFIGKTMDDIFIKGYFGICEISITNKININNKNDDNDDETHILELNRIIYFDKSDINNIKIIYNSQINQELYSKIQDIMSNIYQVDYNMKIHYENLIDYFQSFNSYVNDRDYIDYLIKYNQVDEDDSLENYFLKDFNDFCNKFKENDKIFNNNEYINLINSSDIIIA